MLDTIVTGPVSPALDSRVCPPRVILFAALLTGWGLVTPIAAAAQEAPTGGGAEAASSEQPPSDDEAPSEPEGPPVGPPLPPQLDVPVFAVGAQTVLFAPTLGAGGGSLAAEYDAGPFHVDVLLGLVVSDEIESSLRLSVRGYFVVHRGPIADLSLGVGIGGGYADPVDGDIQMVWDAVAGAKIRSFVGKNIALQALLGVNVTFFGEVEAVAVGARLLGSAGFMYYFR